MDFKHRFRLPRDLEINLRNQFQIFKQTGQDIETYFDRQVIFVNHKETSKSWTIEQSQIHKTIVFIPKVSLNRKNSSKVLYGRIALDCIKSDKPILVPNIEKLPKYLGFDFALSDCSEQQISVEYYKLKIKRMKNYEYLIGVNSNSVPGKCVKWEQKLRIGVYEGNHYWLPSPNLIAKQYSCSENDCLMAFNCEAFVKRHNHSCPSIQKIKTKQKTYGDTREELELLIEMGYLPQSFSTYRFKAMAVFDIECLESKIDTVTPDLGNTILANQIICSIGECTFHIVLSNVTNTFTGLASNIGQCEQQFFVRKSSKPDDGQAMVDNFMDYLFELLKVKNFN